MSQFSSYLTSNHSPVATNSKYLVIDSDQQVQQLRVQGQSSGQTIMPNHSNIYAHTNVSTNNNDSLNMYINNNGCNNSRTITRQNSVCNSNNKNIKVSSIIDNQYSKRVLGNLDTNAYMEGTFANSDKYTREKRNSGVINQCIQDKKLEKIKMEALRLDINKIQMQCSALEKLIDKAVKLQAELQVKKYNLLKNPQHYSISVAHSKHKQNKKQMPSSSVAKPKVSSIGAISQMDIGKTIKATNAKIR